MNNNTANYAYINQIMFALFLQYMTNITVVDLLNYFNYSCCFPPVWEPLLQRVGVTHCDTLICINVCWNVVLQNEKLGNVEPWLIHKKINSVNLLFFNPLTKSCKASFQWTDQWNSLVLGKQKWIYSLYILYWKQHMHIQVFLFFFKASKL